MMYSDALAALPRLSVSGYVPLDGTQVKLSQNESPYDLFPEEKRLLVNVLAEVSLNRYPDPRPVAPVELIALNSAVTADMVLLGNGANELIELLIRATCNPGDEVLTVAPTYHLYDRFAAMNRAQLVKVPWGHQFGFPRQRLRQAISPRTKMILLCRPNNPTGHIFPPDDVLALADRFPGMVVVDEAYYDFCQDTLAPFVNTVKNLVIVRTLSKAYGAAGLRLGYILASDPIITAVRPLLFPYGVNGYSLAIAKFLLSRPQVMERTRTAMVENRHDLAQHLKTIREITVFPSVTNFLLVRTSFSADALDRYLKTRNIFIRNLQWDDRYLRISVGTPGDHARLVEGMRSFVRAGSGASP